MKTIAVIQARTASKRLPGKVLKPFCNGYNTIDYLLHNLDRINGIDEVFIATTAQPTDDVLADYCRNRATVFRGSEQDVLSRYTAIAAETGAGTIVRICADNPFMPRKGIEFLLQHHSGFDYTSFSIDAVPAMLLPMGLFAEVVQADALSKLYSRAREIEKEHVTHALYNRFKHDYRCNFIEAHLLSTALADSRLRLTVDTEVDFELVDAMVNNLEVGLDVDLIVVERMIDYIYSHNLISAMQTENAKQHNTKDYDS